MENRNDIDEIIDGEVLVQYEPETVYDISCEGAPTYEDEIQILVWYYGK